MIQIKTTIPSVSVTDEESVNKIPRILLRFRVHVLSACRIYSAVFKNADPAG